MSCPSGTLTNFHPRVSRESNVGSIEKESASILPPSFVLLSEITRTNGFILFFFAKPGIAAKDSFASPSMAPPSERVQIVTRLFPTILSAMARP